MNFKFLILFFAIAGTVACSRNNEGKYRNIAGTRASIIAPEGFNLSANFIGLEKDASTGIQVIDLVDSNFELNAPTYTKEIFEQKGLSVFEFSDVKIDGFSGKFAHMQGDENTETMMVVFGDATFTLSAMAMFSSDVSGKLAPEIKQALLTMKYDKNLKVDAFASSYFKVLPNDSKFQFAKASGNMFIFSENGIEKKSYENEPMVMLTPLPFDTGATTQDVMESLVDGLIQNGFIVEDVRNTSASQISGYDALSAEYYFKNDASGKLAYLAIIVRGRQAIAFYGVTDKDYDANIIEFKKLLQNLRFK